MGKKNQFEAAKKDIERFFDQAETKAFSHRSLQNILIKNRPNWQISEKRSTNQFIEYLLKSSKLTVAEINQNHLVYCWDTSDELTIINALRSGSYFTHYSAVYIHRLSLQIPKVYYLNYEHARSSTSNSTLTQEGIDQAFSKPQRKTEQIIPIDGRRIYLLNGKYTNKLGVTKESGPGKYYCYTDLERTLIDIAVRPAYAGGVFEVIDIYGNAKKTVDPNRLNSYLRQLDFIYPYHQVIGFYLEVTGYSEEVLGLFHRDMKFDFYLTYDIRSKEYSDKWRLYYPKGINLQDA